MNGEALSHPPKGMPPRGWILSLVPPYLSTDRIERPRRGRSWRSEKQAEVPARHHRQDQERDATGRAQRAGLRARFPARPGPRRSAGRSYLRSKALKSQINICSRCPAASSPEIADWADRYTPLVAEEGAWWRLLLDVTGCAHLFGGEKAALAADIVGPAQAAEVRCRAHAIADAPGAARRNGPLWRRPAVVPSGRPGGDPGEIFLSMRSELAPRRWSRCSSRSASSGHRPARSRAPGFRFRRARFGVRAPPASRPSALASTRRAIIAAVGLLPALDCGTPFAEPISLLSDIAGCCLSLAGAMAKRLGGARRRQARRLPALSLYQRRQRRQSRRNWHRPAAPLTPTGGRVFAEKFALLGDQLDVGFGFDMVRLSVLALDGPAPVQIDLAGEADC